MEPIEQPSEHENVAGQNEIFDSNAAGLLSTHGILAANTDADEKTDTLLKEVVIPHRVSVNINV